jgi:hypothetical protein
MRKKLVFSGMVLLALVLTSGTFAFTYSGYEATTLAGGNIADAVMTTCEESANQPGWENILPGGEYTTEYLIPNAAGSATELPTQYPETGEHWDKVGEITADDAGTYVSTLRSRRWEKDLYQLSDMTGGGGDYDEISGITVYFRIAAGGDCGVRAMAEIRTNGWNFSGDTETTYGTGFTTFSQQWTNNPATGQPWTRDEINALEAGVTMRGAGRNNPALCTQVYVAVNYEFVITEGDVPHGDLYDITPHPDYYGDLLIKVYLVNPAELLKAYQYLNMKIYVENSIEAEASPRYEVLSIENGVAMFNIEGGAAESYTVEVIGGGYRIMSADTSDWGEGWSVVPEFYCEVTQR